MDALRAPFPWQLSQWQSLERLWQAGRLPHALMLAGPSETGKLDFARTLAARVLCAEPREARACGRCKQCLLLAAGSHPDFHFLAPEEAGKAIRIDSIRALGEFAGKTPVQGGWRVIILSPAEAMNSSAANAFLKTLEEPGRNTLLVLISHQASAVPATIRSRCRLQPFPLPSRQLAVQWLTDQGHGGDLDKPLRQAGGRPLRALRFLSTDLAEHLATFESLVSALAERKLSPLEGARKIMNLPEREVVDWFQQYVYQLIRRQSGPDGADTRVYFRFLDRLNRARALLFSSANPNRQLLWEEVLMDWSRVCEQSPAVLSMTTEW